MAHQPINLTPNLYTYMIDNSLHEPEVLQGLREETKKLPNARMQILPEQGQFMTLLIEMLNAKKTLEIGTFTGYSALVVALALPKDGKVIACDISDEWTKIGKKFWQMASVDKKIDLRLGKAAETLQSLLDNDEEGTFDFVFIDADKVNYPFYYEKSLALLRAGGLIMVDNVLWAGKVANPDIHDEDTQAIRQLNHLVHKDPRVTSCIVPMGDGLLLARKR